MAMVMVYELKHQVELCYLYRLLEMPALVLPIYIKKNIKFKKNKIQKIQKLEKEREREKDKHI